MSSDPDFTSHFINWFWAWSDLWMPPVPTLCLGRDTQRDLFRPSVEWTPFWGLYKRTLKFIFVSFHWRTFYFDFLLNGNAVSLRKPSQPKFSLLSSHPFNFTTQCGVCPFWGPELLGAPPISNPPALPEGRESPASGTSSASEAGETGAGTGTGSAPLPATRRRSPPAERPAGCHGDGREARPVRSAGSPEPGRAGGSWDPRTEHGRWETTPLFPLDPLSRRGSQRLRGFSAASSTLAANNSQALEKKLSGV